MAKDPAFLFYPGDWNLGTMHLTLLEKGCYIELLILQFAKGRFTEAQAKHMLNGSFDLAWANIKDKFETDGVFYWNRRLQEEKEKRQKFSESRRINGLSPKKANKHMLKHMEDENKDDKLNSWEQEKRLFLNAEQWQYKQCTEYQISKNALMEYINVFVKRIELQEDYKPEKELKKHCANWLRKNISIDKTKALEEKRILPENYWTD
jgi:hypothetical protein